MSLARLRTLFFPAFLVSLTILLASLALESVAGRVFCALCYSQRVFLGAYMLLGIGAVIHAPGRRGYRVYALALLACAGVGAWLAARQVWLQGAHVAQVECQTPLATLAELPLSQALHRLILGGPECRPISWSFLDLTLPEWSLLAFLGLAALPLTYLLAYRLRTLLKE